MTRFKDQPIRRQIVLITCAMFLPFSLMVIWSADQSRREGEGELSQQAGSVAATAAAYLNQYLAGFDSLASALAKHPAVIALDRTHCNALFGAVLSEQPLILNIVLTDPAGELKCTGVEARASLGSVVSLPYVKQVTATRQPVVSGLATGQVTGKPTIVLGYPVLAEAGGVVGVIGVGINLARLQTVFGSIPLPEGSVITVTDSASRVLARSLDPERYIGTAIETHPLSPQDVPSLRVTTGVDGVSRFYGNAAVDRGAWVVSVGIPTSTALARIAPVWRRNAIVVLSTVVVLLALSIWFSNMLGRGLNGLRLAAQRIAGGDLSPPLRHRVPNLELAQLQDAFITMAANLRETREALDRQVEQERKMRETLQSLQRQVVRQERLAAVGVLVSGVAHELNNPLQAILGTAELLERHPGMPVDMLDEIAFVKTQSGRAREIIRNLSRFSSQQPGPPSLVDVREVVAEVVQLRSRDLDNLAISLDVDLRSTRKVFANFTELEQVILNFVINAQQSVETVGRARGHIRIVLVDAGRKIRLEVQDDGAGVTAEDEPKLFQPFFTTKPVGKGTGLGLSVSYGIIESYGGVIGHKGNEWGGATFFFELPTADAPAATTAPDDRSPVLHPPVPTKF